MSESGRKTLGANIRKQRQAIGISQEHLADISGLHRTYVGAVERGERNISIDNIIALANALKLTTEALVRGVR